VGARLARAQDLFVAGSGVTLAVRDYGGAGEPAILVHGGPGQNLATWDTFVPHLAAEMRAVALDMRGNGASDDSDDYSWPALVSDIHAVVRHFGFSRPLIVGHSWGGQLATYYASQYSETGGVVAIEGWITDVRTELADDVWEWMRADYADDPFITFAGTEAQLKPMLAAITRMYGAGGAAVARRQLIEGNDGLLRWRRSVDQLVHIQRTIDAEGAVLSTDLYARIACPVLLVGGERSEAEVQAAREGKLGPWAFSRSATQPVLARYDHVRAMWLPCGHDIPHELPERLAGLIKQFVASICRIPVETLVTPASPVSSLP
jgi:pimeloyl-ACP methyl ester carboxylesterase